MRFCGRIIEEGYHLQFTILFSTRFNMGKVTIVGMEISLSVDQISSSTCISCHGEQWFKDMELDIENYKQFLNPYAREEPYYLFTFRHLRN